MAIRPKHTGKPCCFALCGSPIGCSNQSGDAVVRRVAIDETAEHGCVDDRAFGIGQSGRIPDPFGIGARSTRQQRHAGGCQRQTQTGHVQVQSLGHAGKNHCRLACDIGLIDMRIGPIADQAIGRSRHLVRKIGMQIERRDNRNIWSDGFSHDFQQRAVRVQGFDAHHGSVTCDIDCMDWGVTGQLGLDRGQDAFQNSFLQRAAGFRGGHEDGKDFGVDMAANLRQESRDFCPLSRRITAGVAQDRVALEPCSKVEITPLCGRCKAIAFQVKPQDGYSDHASSHSGVSKSEA